MHFVACLSDIKKTEDRRPEVRNRMFLAVDHLSASMY